MISLEKFEHKDIPKLLSWITTPEFLLQWCGRTFTYPLDELQLSEYVNAANLPSGNRFVFKAVDKANSVHFGNISLDRVNYEDGTASVTCVIIGVDEYKGKGNSKVIMDELIRFAAVELGLKKLYLNVFDFNLPAIKSYERSGFIEIERKKIEHGSKEYINVKMELLLH